MIEKCEITLEARIANRRFGLNNIQGWILQAIDGLGIVNIVRHSQRYPGQPGDTDRGYSEMPRFMTLRLVNQGYDNANLYELRGLLQGIFRPRDDDPVQLVMKFPHHVRRAADVNLFGELDHLPSGRLDGVTQESTFVLKASDPRLYDPEEKTLTFVLSNYVNGWDIRPILDLSADGWDIEQPGVFTQSVGWNIGATNVYEIQTFTYGAGSINAVAEYPVIRIDGPIDNPIISNLTTNETIPLNANGGLSLTAGEYAIIDLGITKKTIVDNTGADVSQYLATSNDLRTWHFAPNGELLYDGTYSDGTNSIRIEGQNVAAGVTSITITYYDRFLGV